MHIQGVANLVGLLIYLSIGFFYSSQPKELSYGESILSYLYFEFFSLLVFGGVFLSCLLVGVFLWPSPKDLSCARLFYLKLRFLPMVRFLSLPQNIPLA